MAKTTTYILTIVNGEQAFSSQELSKTIPDSLAKVSGANNQCLSTVGNTYIGGFVSDAPRSKLRSMTADLRCALHNQKLILLARVAETPSAIAPNAALKWLVDHALLEPGQRH